MDGKVVKPIDLFVCFSPETAAPFGWVRMEHNTNSLGWEMLPCAGHAAGGSSREKRVQEHRNQSPAPPAPQTRLAYVREMFPSQISFSEQCIAGMGQEGLGELTTMFCVLKKEIPQLGAQPTGNAPAQLEKPPCTELVEVWQDPGTDGGNILECFCNPDFRDLQDSAASQSRGRCGLKETGLGLEEADFCVNIPGDLCGEEFTQFTQ